MAIDESLYRIPIFKNDPEAAKSLKKWQDAIEARIEQLEGVPGEIPQFDSDGNLVSSGKTAPGGDILGTTDTQTMTNKTIDGGTISGATIEGTGTSRLSATDASGALGSTDLDSWITETATRVTVADDGDGTVTLSAPDNPTYVGLTLTGSIGVASLEADESTTVPNTNVTASSYIFIAPYNASAATLASGPSSPYVTNRVADTSFDLDTANGGAAAGTEQFAYVVIG